MAVRRRSKASESHAVAAKAWAKPAGPVGAAQAKTHLLSIMDEVRENGVPVIVTRRGKPHVQIAPIAPEAPMRDIFGCMKGTVVVTGDIIGPEPDEWEAMQ